MTGRVHRAELRRLCLCGGWLGLALAGACACSPGAGAGMARGTVRINDEISGASGDIAAKPETTQPGATDADAGDRADVTTAANGRGACDPCTLPDDCTGLGAGAACTAIGKPAGSAGFFCTLSCEGSGECPTGFYCDSASGLDGKAGKRCIPQDDRCGCSALATAQGWTTPCFAAAYDGAGSAIGTCPGTFRCGADGSGSCDAKLPQVEVCDGADNDCDGQTDEDGATPLCDDGNPCTPGDACVAGKCQIGADICGCHADADCAAAPGVDLCKGKPVCDNSSVPYACTSLPGTAVVCDTTQDTPCLTHTCDPNTGACKAILAATGTPCDADGSLCTTGDSCTAGVCVAGAKLACEDGNSCTANNCDAKKGCQYVPIPGACDADGSACTVGDQCAGGVCVAGKAKVCDDGNPCTADACDPKTGVCSAKPVAGPCEDGSGCTSGDHCASGVCQPGIFTCECASDADCAGKNNGNLCLGQFVCGQIGGSPHCFVKPGTPVVCATDADTLCAKAICQPVTGLCKATPQNDGEACSDGNACTTGEMCAAGSCGLGATVSCDDANPCTDDACTPQKGCSHAANTVACDADGSVCTVGDACGGGICQPGPALACDDGNPCTTDACDATTGCTHSANNLPCDDGDGCTGPDACGGGACLAGPKKVCDDGNPCTVDACKAGACVTDPAPQEGKSCPAPAGCASAGVCAAGVCTYQAATCPGGIHAPWPFTIPSSFGPASVFFDPVGYHAIDLALTPGDWQAYLADVKAASTSTAFYHATVTIDGKAFADVGVRKFGYGSMLVNPAKPNLRIKFNQFNGVLHGPDKLDNVRLKASGQDSTFLREPLTYALARNAGGVAPRTSWARLKVNGEAYGLYLVEEQIDGNLFKTWFGNKDGSDFKPALGCVGLNCPNGDCSTLGTAYEISAGTLSSLIALATAVADTSAKWADKVAGLVDLDEFLTFYAIDALLSNIDSLASSGNNFEAYVRTDTNRIMFINSGCDLTFGNWGAWYDLWAPWGPPTAWCTGYDDPFYKRAVATPALKAKLTALLHKLHCGGFATATVNPMIDGFKNILKNDLYLDPKGVATPAQIDADIYSLKVYVTGRNKLLDTEVGACP